jgi:hypothetical protein
LYIFTCRLDALVGDSSKYIAVNCLRRWDVLYDALIENQIYIHSKLMIVDDEKVSCFLFIPFLHKETLLRNLTGAYVPVSLYILTL